MSEGGGRGSRAEENNEEAAVTTGEDGAGERAGKWTVRKREAQ